MTLFTDEFRCPIPAGALARALWEFASHRRSGLYHLGGCERLSRWEIAELLARWYPELAPMIRPGSVADYHGPPRPPDLSMRTAPTESLPPTAATVTPVAPPIVRRPVSRPRPAVVPVTTKRAASAPSGGAGCPSDT